MLYYVLEMCSCSTKGWASWVKEVEEEEGAEEDMAVMAEAEGAELR